MTTYLIPTAGLLLLAGILWLVYRGSRPASRPGEGLLAAAGRWRDRAMDAGRSWFAGRSLPFLGGLGARLRPAGPALEPAAPPPRVVSPPAPPRTLTPPQPAASVNGTNGSLAPPFAAAVAAIAAFEPEDDSDLIGFMNHAAAFQSAQADAWRTVFETCLNGLGLDPASIRGVAEYADVQGDTAADAAGMAAQFATVYQQVREWLSSGGTLPHDGRWLTGEV